MKFYQKAQKFVEDSFGKNRMTHFERTVFWVKTLDPKAKEALLIAAISHDIERAFRNEENKSMEERERGFLDAEHIEFHQKESGRIIYDFLMKEKAGMELAGEVRSLVEKHETGGDAESDILKDADSLSFFENNVHHFIADKAVRVGKRKVKEKFDRMFERISSEKARSFAESWYREAIKNLNC